MSCGTCFSNPCRCARVPAACNCPPSPTPPWSRPTVNPQVQTLTDDGSISLTNVATFLDATAAKDPVADYAATLPNGNYKQQRKEIYVPGANKDTTQNWVVTGTFMGFTSLKFDTLGWSAMLSWDGAAWHIIGGNATPQT